MQTEVAAGVRVLHAVPAVPAIEVYLDGRQAFGDVAYGWLTDYAEVAPGRHRLQASAEGVAVEEELELRPGELETLVVGGLRSRVHTFRMRDNTRAFERDRSRVRFVHTSPDAPALDVTVVGGPVLFHGVARGTATPFETVEAGTYDLDLRAAPSGERILTLPGLTLAGGTIYSLVALGLRWSEPELRLIPFLEAIEICTPG